MALSNGRDWNGHVFFVTAEGLHAVDAVTGTRQWLFETLPGVPVGNSGVSPRMT